MRARVRPSRIVVRLRKHTGFVPCRAIARQRLRATPRSANFFLSLPVLVPAPCAALSRNVGDADAEPSFSRGTRRRLRLAGLLQLVQLPAQCRHVGGNDFQGPHHPAPVYHRSGSQHYYRNRNAVNSVVTHVQRHMGASWRGRPPVVRRHGRRCDIVVLGHISGHRAESDLLVLGEVPPPPAPSSCQACPREQFGRSGRPAIPNNAADFSPLNRRQSHGECLCGRSKAVHCAQSVPAQRQRCGLRRPPLPVEQLSSRLFSRKKTPDGRRDPKRELFSGSARQRVSRDLHPKPSSTPRNVSGARPPRSRGTVLLRGNRRQNVAAVIEHQREDRAAP